MTITHPVMSPRKTSWELPIFQREMRAFWRGWRKWVLITACCIPVFLCVWILVLYCQPNHTEAKAANQLFGLINCSGNDPDYFNTLLLLLQAIFLILTPILAAGAFARERQHHTLEPLLLTRMSNTSIAFSKFCSAMTLVPLMLLLALPVGLLYLLFSAEAFPDFLFGQFVIFADLLYLAVLSLYCSTFIQRIAVAVPVAIITGLLTLGAPLLAEILNEIMYSFTDYYSSDLYQILAWVGVLLAPALAFPLTHLLALIVRGVIRRPPERATLIALWIGITVAIASFSLLIPALMENSYFSGYDLDDHLFSAPAPYALGAAILLFWLTVVRVGEMRRAT